MSDGGPGIKHSHDYSAWLRDLGVQEVTGQDISSRLVGTVAVDDLRHLQQPIPIPTYGWRCLQPAQPAEYGYAQVIAQGSGINIRGIVATANITAITLNGRAPAGAAGPTPENPALVMGRGPDFSLDDHTTVLERGTTLIAPPQRAPIFGLFSQAETTGMPWYIGPGQTLLIRTTGVNAVLDLSLFFSEIPLARRGQ